MANLRWGADAPGDAESARARLLDAAERCFARFGVMKITVEDVAAEARVSRATVYRYFDGRDALVRGVVLRHAERFLRRLEERVKAQTSFTTSIVEGVLFTIDAVHEDPQLALLFAPDAAGLTGRIVGGSEALFTIARSFLGPLFEPAQRAGQLRAGVDLNEASEWILRCIVSLLTLRGPAHRSKSDLRRFVTTFVVPPLVAAAPPEEPARAPAADSVGR